MFRRTFLQFLGLSPLTSIFPKEQSAAQEKAFSCLLATGFDSTELEQVKRDICALDANHSVNSFYERRFCYAINYLSHPFNGRVENKCLELDISKSRIWDAIVVTMKTGQDGFSMLGVSHADKLLDDALNNCDIEHLNQFIEFDDLPYRVQSFCPSTSSFASIKASMWSNAATSHHQRRRPMIVSKLCEPFSIPCLFQE